MCPTRQHLDLRPVPLHALDRAAERPRDPAYVFHDPRAGAGEAGGAWVSVSWGELGAQVRAAARGLIALGVREGERVCLLSDNRPEWLITAHAAMCAGAAPAGVYATSAPAEARFVVEHAEARVLVVDTEERWARLRPALEGLSSLEVVVGLWLEGAQGEGAQEAPRLMSWASLNALGEGAALDEELARRLSALKGDDPATYIYTSGTTGPPKAAALSHNNLSWTAQAAVRLVGFGRGDRTLSYLPLSHIAEQMFTIHGPATVGSTVYFARSMAHLLEDLKVARPSLFFGVPRVWEKMHEGLSARLGALAGLKGRLVPELRRVTAIANDHHNRGSRPPLSVRLRYALAKELFGKVKAALGLDRARVCVSGSAPIRAEVLEFFSSLDLRILEVYGQSEGSGPTTFNAPGAVRYGSVGRPVPGVEVRLAEDGEVLVRGPNVFLGYLKDPAATAASFDEEGFLRSGDLGAFDEEGFLRITGRKKELIITAGGKNIAPRNIEEALLTAAPLLADAVVVGDRRRYLTALVTLSPEPLAAFAAARGLQGDAAALSSSPEVYEEVMRAVARVNADLAPVEQLKRVCALPRPLSVEGGELTPTLKLRRAVIAARYAPEIEAMYAADAPPSP